MVLDYIIGNHDRHTNNFGLVRNADTLEWIGPAPIFDSGTSLGCQLRTDEIMGQAGIHSKPFRDLASEQIKLVSSLDWVDFDSLYGAMDDVGNVMDGSESLIDERRKTALMDFIRSRIDGIRSMSDRIHGR